MKKNKDIVYGNVELTSDDLDMNQAKIRITTMIDFPVYEALKKKAKTMGIGYQTLINIILNLHINEEASILVSMKKKVTKKGKKSA